jgi:multisubunit Na+/H+ antiporter MnhB subunit
MLATLLIAAGEAEPSKTAFYIFAVALVAFALGLSAVGVARHETFPPSRGAATALIGVCILLVAGTMLSAVLTA